MGTVASGADSDCQNNKATSCNLIKGGPKKQATTKLSKYRIKIRIKTCQ